MSVVQRFDDLKEEVREGVGERIVALRKDIHREPELGFDTEKTAGKVLAALDGLPLDIRTGVAENGVVATLKGEGDGPTVGLRADMDALPILRRRGCRSPRRWTARCTPAATTDTRACWWAPSTPSRGCERE